MHHISPISPLYLPYISPRSPLDLPLDLPGALWPEMRNQCVNALYLLCKINRSRQEAAAIERQRLERQAEMTSMMREKHSPSVAEVAAAHRSRASSSAVPPPRRTHAEVAEIELLESRAVLEPYPWLSTSHGTRWHGSTSQLALHLPLHCHV